MGRGVPVLDVTPSRLTTLMYSVAYTLIDPAYVFKGIYNS